MLGIACHLKEVMCKESQGDIPYALVVMGETAIPMDVLECIGEEKATFSKYQPLYDEIERHLTLSKDEKQAIKDFAALRKAGLRIEGQTSDLLRRAGVHIVMKALPILIRSDLIIVDPMYRNKNPAWDELRVFSNEPRHLLRSIPPDTLDVITARRLGTLAVDNAMAGFTDYMISQWLTEFVLVPLELVVLGRKRIPKSGIFWKSVQAKTGQREDLVSPWRPK